MLQDTDSDLLQLTKSITQIIKCYKCKRQLDPANSRYISGNIACSQRPGSKCIFTVSSKFIEQLVEILPKPCKFSDRGCSNVSLSGRHEMVCELRTIKCVYVQEQSCPWSGTVKDWKSHVKSTHDGKNVVHIPTYARKDWYLNYKFDPSWNGDCIYCEVGSKVFLFVMKRSGDKILFAARYIPQEKFNNEIYLKLYGSQGNYRNRNIIFKSAVQAKVLEDDETLENIICEFHGVTMSDVTDGEVYMSFEPVN